MLVLGLLQNEVESLQDMKVRVIGEKVVQYFELVVRCMAQLK